MNLTEKLQIFLKNKFDETDELKGVFQRNYEGEQTIIFQWTNVPFSRKMIDKFTSIHLDVRGFNDIKRSFINYMKPELLIGDNQYEADNFGKQDAK